MFKKILIANRGEIACRVMKTAKKMGIQTVAVYSDADADALHVQMADEAVHIGPAAAAESYLIPEKILEAAKATGAEAIHPGYGFLSERASFVEAVQAAGLSFIGPDPYAITSMGDKITSKELAAKAGVSTVPGHMDIIQDAEEAMKISKEIGYPVMLKASAGGGGKGMRIAWNDEEAAEGYISAQNEARSSFGDDRVFIEKFIEEPRHIEIQVLGDKHGNVIYLGERECSIQRRHQKVVEEAPSPFLDEKTRKAMGEESIALAKAVDYCSAGTVEFIVDKNRNFYFLEMNTRLQVEHPVTEFITGVDLVEQMLRVANGEKLSMTQEDVKLTGWAVENRVYAEDPIRGFLPSIGRLTKYKAPKETESVRVDTGVYEGAEISMYYDPMIAKLVTYGHTRKEAIDLQRQALDQYYIRGISHNMTFLSALMAHPRFQSGNMTTNFIAEEYPDGFEGGALRSNVKTAMIAAAMLIHGVYKSRETQIKGQVEVRDGPQAYRWTISLGEEQSKVSIIQNDDGIFVAIDDRKVTIETDWVPGQEVIEIVVNGATYFMEVDITEAGYLLTSDGVSQLIQVQSPRAAELTHHMPEVIEADMSKYLLCPMPGLIISIDVAEGEDVKAGQALAVVEAMKMENILRAEKDATVKSIKAVAGDSLQVDEVIIEFE
ncbi:acetyl/propionyl/methylcrotonyl-CoA carboxylase subunit alpha [Temperatibacter marinus]|uniref:propionyl-CoA carboxylase n=1 Tax=Temperatibacter marinus TaxID=1456591 RepID=A0AA52H7Z2_9PROT|nr:acetyl/propionyl/methylcrotonyl-CoA carboxylase subunit alpha [Temperatibacter marinus]WND01581.1 acetyl/propionyl/methylcrotonyl-CoA carboxylase subunit alpha [Temperatibacter marinus]